MQIPLTQRTRKKYLIPKLIDEENIPAIEELLHVETKRLHHLEDQKEKGRLDFGDIVTQPELERIVPTVYEEVDGMLGTEQVEVDEICYMDPPPSRARTRLEFVGAGAIFACAMVYGADLNADGNLTAASLIGISGIASLAIGTNRLMNTLFYECAYKNAFYPEVNSVTLEQATIPDIVSAIGHEYTHRVQKEFGLSKKVHEPFKEGHARSVERELCHLYHEREDNEAYLYGMTHRMVGELKSAYMLVCLQNGKEPRRGLLSTPTMCDAGERHAWNRKKEPSSHAFGNTLVSLHERKAGHPLNRQLLDGSYIL